MLQQRVRNDTPELAERCMLLCPLASLAPSAHELVIRSGQLGISLADANEVSPAASVEAAAIKVLKCILDYARGLKSFE